jgi:hypothetical protein
LGTAKPPSCTSKSTLANAKTVSSEVASELNNDGEGTKDSGVVAPSQLLLPLAATLSSKNGVVGEPTSTTNNKSTKSNGGKKVVVGGTADRG